MLLNQHSYFFIHGELNRIEKHFAQNFAQTRFDEFILRGEKGEKKYLRKIFRNN
jgi:hypothetical protein